MAEQHPDSRLLESFMRSELPEQERRVVVRHLLTGCPRCVSVTRQIWSLADEPRARPDLSGSGSRLHPASYRDVFDRILRTGTARERQVAAERREAPRLLAELLDHRAAARLALVCGDERFASPSLCELLIERSREADDPAVAVQAAELAVAVAGRLKDTVYGATLLRSLSARSWAWLGNARRLAGDPEQAESALETAERTYREGPGDPLEGAELLCLRGSLLGERGKLEEAERLLDRALAVYRASGERHAAGRALVQKATVRGWTQEEGAVAEAVRLLREGLSLLDEGKDSRFTALAHHRLALLLAEAGLPEEALGAVRQARRLYEELGDAPDLVRLRRLEGNAEAALGRTESAEAALLGAWRGFLEHGLGAEAAAAVLELALLYKRQGRSSDLHRIAGDELRPIFFARDVQNHTAAALLVFRRIVETEHANVEFLFEIARFLAGPPRSRRPHLRWAR